MMVTHSLTASKMTPAVGNKDKSHRRREWTAGLNTLTMMDIEDLENNQKDWV